MNCLHHLGELVWFIVVQLDMGSSDSFTISFKSSTYPLTRKINKESYWNFQSVLTGLISLLDGVHAHTLNVT